MTVGSTKHRLTLDQLIQTSGETYLSISLLLGRNAAYVQQFIKRGTPRKLDEDDRHVLAVYFGVDDRVLRTPPRINSPRI